MPKPPKDPNQAAKHVIDQVGKNPAAVALGRLGGIKSGSMRMENLTAKQRKEIAKKAAKARWSKKSPQ